MTLTPNTKNTLDKIFHHLSWSYSLYKIVPSGQPVNKKSKGAANKSAEERPVN